MAISIDYGIAADAHYDLAETQVRDLIPAIEAADIEAWKSK